MTHTDVRDWLSIAAALVALPAAAFGMFLFLRHWRTRARKEAGDGLPQDKELAYLAAVGPYMSELNRPLGYAADEFTPGEGRVVDEAQINLRYVFRRAKAADTLGLTPGEITGSDAARRVGDVTAALRDARQTIVLLGDPGSGKSVTLRHLAQSLAAQPVYVNAMPLLPVYLHLGRYRQIGKGGLPERFAQFVKDELKQAVPRGEVVLSVLDDALAQGRIFLLLDAMDEMPTRHYAERVEQIKRFLVEHGGRNRVVIACRRREYTGALPHAELIVEPFRPSHIRAYLDKHWALYASRLGVAAADPAVHRAYTALADPGHPMYRFATNPFSLKLVANYFFATGGRVPAAQAELFDNYVSRRLAIEGARRKLTPARQAEVLAAWQAMAFDALQNNLGTYLRRPEGSTAQAKVSTEALEIGVHCGLLREEADGAVRFEHHRLLEYLAALHWDRQDQMLAIERDHLTNPWWRETLVLRAAITAEPEALIKRVVLAIDPRYLSVLHLRIGDAPPPTQVDDSQELRLNGIVALELALACMRQREAAVSSELFEWLAPLVMAIPSKGSLIERVRLARSLRGIAIRHSHPALAALATTDSDWLASEVFAAIDEADFGSPEFSTILAALLGSKSERRLLTRLFAVKGLSWSALLRAAPKKARRNALRALLTDVAVMLALVAMVLLVVLSLSPYVGFFTAAELQQVPAQLSLAGALFALTLIAGLVGGWRTTLAIVLMCSLSFAMLPVLTAQRITIALFFYHLSVSPIYRRGVWLRNSLTRYFRVGLALPAWHRVAVLFTFATPVVILAYVAATSLPMPSWPRIVSALALTALAEGAIRAFARLRLGALTRRATEAADQEALRAHLRACVEALRQPTVPSDGARLLDHMVGLNLDESELISALQSVASSQQHFLSNESILQAIDRVDLRRRQRALGGT
ncbi:MAG: NACHT domain-containing protein [Rubrivivax sp.]|nr:NACHT domain-containing protein [Rubrivivax sp.]